MVAQRGLYFILASEDEDEKAGVIFLVVVVLLLFCGCVSTILHVGAPHFEKEVGKSTKEGKKLGCLLPHCIVDIHVQQLHLGLKVLLQLVVVMADLPTRGELLFGHLLRKRNSTALNSATAEGATCGKKTSLRRARVCLVPGCSSKPQKKLSQHLSSKHPEL